jgi:hypothetical protein
MGKKSGSGIRIRYGQPGSYFREPRKIVWVKILKFFDADPGWKKFGSGIRDGKNSDLGSGIGTHPGYPTLVVGGGACLYSEKNIAVVSGGVCVPCAGHRLERVLPQLLPHTPGLAGSWHRYNYKQF